MVDLIGIASTALQIPDQLKKLGKAEMAETVLAVTQGFFDQVQENLNMKEEISSLKAQLREKDNDIKQLKDISSLKMTWEFKNNCYWNQKGHPVCSVCLERPIDPAPIRMHTRSDGFATCPQCKNTVWSKGEPSDTGMSFGAGEPYSRLDHF